MPTSVTGTSTSRPLPRGFTLVELLVVILIVGLVSGAALLSIRGSGDERLAREEVRRIERLVGLASDESVYRMLELGIEFSRDGYRFLRWDGEQWSPLPDPGALRERRWPGAVTPALQVEGKPESLPPAFAAEDPTPQVVFLSSGEVSAFRLELVTEGGAGEALQVHLTAATEREPLGVAP